MSRTCRIGAGALRTAAAAVISISSASAALTVSLRPSVPSPARLGTLVTWTAAVPNAPGARYWYRFTAHAFDETPRVVKDFGPDSTFDWAPVEREGYHAVEVGVRNLDTGEEGGAAAGYELLSNAEGGSPAIRPTSHPLVFLYSAPVCNSGATMTLYFLDPATGRLQNAPARRCDGLFSMNFYIAGLREKTFYYVKHIIFDHGSYIEGPVMSFTAGVADAETPVATVVEASANPGAEQVQVFGSVFARFMATDLTGRLIWYYPQTILFLTHPEPGGYFWGIDEVPGAPQTRQVVRLFDLAGMTIQETNAARVNEQVVAMGKRPIGGFHHEARFLSDGRILVLATVEQIMNDVQGRGPVNIVGDMIIVMNRDLEVVWTWDAFDHLDVRRQASQGDLCAPNTCPPLYLADTGNDWLHGNAVTETPDGNLLYSTRSQDWVIKIAYRNGYGAGEVLWKLGKDGDFRLDNGGADAWFSHQHDPEIEADGTMSLLDNGNLRQEQDPDAHSRGQVYRLDETNRVAHLVLNTDLGGYAFALGSAERLRNGNYVFDVGFLADASAQVLEVDGSGRRVAALKSAAPTYRAFRLTDMYSR